jgi:hypothetical protein
MSLQPGPLFDSDATGATEQITLKPTAPATSTSATITNVYYGMSVSSAPTPVTVDPGGQSFSITVLSGIFALTILMVSPNPQNEVVQLWQGSTQIDEVTIRGHSGSSAVLIRGT